MLTPIIGEVNFYQMNFYFFVYAFLGWVVEVIFATLKTGKFVNRGFLNGPICPIYGVGMTFCIIFLNQFESSWWLLFLFGGLFATTLELVIGFILERLFDTKWWDYSKQPFNFKGYICLSFSIIWGLSIMLVFKTVVPVIDKLISIIPIKLGYVILIVLWIVFLADLITDIIQLVRLKKHINEINKIASTLNKESDLIGSVVSKATISVKEKVEILTKKIEKIKVFKAFPKLKEIKEKAFEKLKKQEKDEKKGKKN